MKKSISLMLLVTAAVAVAATGTLRWESTNVEIGEVKVNVATPVEFSFTNTGGTPVYILEAKGSCGCTVVDYPKEAIEAGMKATIRGSFRSSKAGVFKKQIKVKTSASDDEVYLYFSGEVVD